VTYEGASTDLSKVLIAVASNDDVRWPGDPTPDDSSLPSLYQYTTGRSGPPALVGLDSAGSLIGACGVSAGPAGVTPFPPKGAISADGSTVFFTVVGADDHNCNLGEPPVDQIFARIAGGEPGAHTVSISAPTSNAECTSVACQGALPRDAEFQAASSDASKVFFTSTQQLTDAASNDTVTGDSATANSGEGCSQTTGPSGCNLYVYDFQNASGHELVDASAADPNPRVQGVAAVSSDGSHVYFVARGVLTGPQENSSGVAATKGANNLYVFERDAAFPAGRTSFIATLSAADSREWGGGEAGVQHVATATPDGRFLVFTSVADLAPDDTSTAQQVFRYDAQSGQLLRVSIGQSGFNDNGNTSAFDAQIPSTSTLVHGSGLAISDDGAYVVFQSADGLTPGALNGQPTDTSGVVAQNVYEYHSGNVQLLSDGRDASSVKGESSVSFFAAGGITGSGNDVFFRTADPLVPQDTDTQQDIYDARIGGGFPGSSLPPQCQGEACQPLSVPPADGTPGSSSFTGPGNPTPGAPVRSTPKPLTPLQKLANALKACKKEPKKRRAPCIAKARKRYGTKASAKRTKRTVRRATHRAGK
jgi:hypothetical protein